MITIGIVGILLVVADVLLIFFDPSRLAPYFTAVCGICLIVAGFVGHRAVRNTGSAG
ncbi:hypothetical protein [Cryobacterium melibiosiphilum]|uniref:hypothetical protein n=1 Tax=Cryobacterium melibiosiphilum TaxID=995039 RepID=UPI001F289E5D|nr:hypothetical protein [Cryobacterium melibiosiphilum]